jgi:hypothetical protein
MSAEEINQRILNPNSDFFKFDTSTPYINPAKPSKHKKFAGKYNYNKPPKPDDTAQWEFYEPGWENNNNNNNIDIIDND